MAEADGSTSLVKACKHCGETKPLEKFPKCSRARDGREGRCTSCSHAARSASSKQAAVERVKRWKRDNADHWRSIKAAQDLKQRRARGARSKAELFAAAAERSACASVCRAIRTAKREEAIWLKREACPWLHPDLTGAEAYALRYKLDADFHLRERLRLISRKRRYGRTGELIRASLKAGARSRSIERSLGYSIDELKRHLERQFQRDMTWSDFSSGRIHIDHIVPLTAFDLSDPSEAKAAWALSNLRPLWAAENMAKAAKREFLL